MEDLLSVPAHTEPDTDDTVSAGLLLLAALSGDYERAHTVATTAVRAGRQDQLTAEVAGLIGALTDDQPLGQV